MSSLLSEYLRLVVVRPVPAAGSAGSGRVLEERLVVEAELRAHEARLVVGDVAGLPRRGQRRLRLRRRPAVFPLHSTD